MNLPEIFHNFVVGLILIASKLGYVGIFIGMFLESTVIPIPSELIMIPAGISSSEGLLNIFLVIILGVLGNLLGAIFSYFIALKAGRPILVRLGKYFLLTEKNIIKVENFFYKHGPISIFIGRLIPGVRHFISLPAGLAKMNLKIFCLYSFLGSLLWTSILAVFGYYIGRNHDLIKENMPALISCVVSLCIILLIIYIFFKPTRK